jgi:hypothetical protein
MDKGVRTWSTTTSPQSLLHSPQSTLVGQSKHLYTTHWVGVHAAANRSVELCNLWTYEPLKLRTQCTQQGALHQAQKTLQRMRRILLFLLPLNPAFVSKPSTINKHLHSATKMLLQSKTKPRVFLWFQGSGANIQHCLWVWSYRLSWPCMQHSSTKVCSWFGSTKNRWRYLEIQTNPYSALS